MKSQGHLGIVLHESPWPFVLTMGLSGGVVSLITWMNGSSVHWVLALMGVVLPLFMWIRDVSRESTLLGAYSSALYTALKHSMMLFILSEALFFAGFFWGLFSNLWSPDLVLGGMWPSAAHSPFTMNALELPLVNTLILLSSGCAVTWAHHALLSSVRGQTVLSLALAVLLGTTFLYFQVCEYQELPFSLSDGVFGTCFYMLTGFHGFHVLVGTIFLLVTTVMAYKFLFTYSRSYFFDFAIWYWHFVDVVWLFLFLSLYLLSF